MQVTANKNFYCVDLHIYVFLIGFSLDSRVVFKELKYSPSFVMTLQFLSINLAINYKIIHIVTLTYHLLTYPEICNNLFVR